MLDELKISLIFLTRLPIRVGRPIAAGDLAIASWCFPLVGVVVGGSGALAFAAASLVHLPAMPASLLAVAVMVLLTGALHEDGLADTADGIGGGRSREHALEIMRDSHIGSFGAVALVLALVARISAISGLEDPSLVAAVLVGAAATSRAAMPVVMHLLSGARKEGQAAAAGRPDSQRAIAAVLIGAALCLLLLPHRVAVTAFAAAALTAAAVAQVARSKLGGYTGDVLGAVQQVAEIAFLFAAVAVTDAAS